MDRHNSYVRADIQDGSLVRQHPEKVQKIALIAVPAQCKDNIQGKKKQVLVEAKDRLEYFLGQMLHEIFDFRQNYHNFIAPRTFVRIISEKRLLLHKFYGFEDCS
jgi:hypothetical protein